MSALEDTPRDIRQGEELDTAKLAVYLERQFGPGEVSVSQFPGGHSNLTYLVRHGDREYVLRRPPFGSKVKSAHDMGREFTVLTKLSEVYDRAPRPFAYEATGDVLGIKFFDIEATEPIPTGKTQVRMEFAYDGGGFAKGGTVTLYSDGKEVGTGRVELTQGFIF